MTHKDQLIDNPYLNLTPGQVDKLLTTIDTFAESCKYNRGDLYREEMIKYLTAMKSPDSEFIHFLHQLQLHTRSTTGFYNHFIALLEVPIIVEKEYNLPIQETLLNSEQMQWVDDVLTCIKESSPKHIDRKDFNYHDDESMFAIRGVRTRFHKFMRYHWNTAETLVKWAVDNKMSLNTMYEMVERSCSGKYIRWGYFPTVEGSKMIVKQYDTFDKLKKEGLVL